MFLPKLGFYLPWGLRHINTRRITFLEMGPAPCNVYSLNHGKKTFRRLMCNSKGQKWNCNYKLQLNFWGKCSDKMEEKGLQSGRTCLKFADSEGALRPLGHNQTASYTVERKTAQSFSQNPVFIFISSCNLQQGASSQQIIIRCKVAQSPWVEPESDLPVFHSGIMLFSTVIFPLIKHHP